MPNGRLTPAEAIAEATRRGVAVREAAREAADRIARESEGTATGEQQGTQPSQTSTPAQR